MLVVQAVRGEQTRESRGPAVGAASSRDIMIIAAGSRSYDRFRPPDFACAAFLSAKKNPAWEAGYTGYCCCRVFGFYFSDEAVLVLLLSLYLLFSASNYRFYSSYLASSGFDVCVQISNIAIACKNLFLCAPNI